MAVKRYVAALAAFLLVSCVAVTLNAEKQKEKAKPASTHKDSADPKPLPKLLDLGSTSCMQCRLMTPVLDELAKEYKGQLKVVFIDIRKDRDSIEKYSIKVIPTQIFYDAKGKELFRHQGYMSKADVVRKFNDLGVKLNPSKAKG